LKGFRVKVKASRSQATCFVLRARGRVLLLPLLLLQFGAAATFGESKPSGTSAYVYLADAGSADANTVKGSVEWPHEEAARSIDPHRGERHAIVMMDWMHRIHDSRYSFIFLKVQKVQIIMSERRAKAARRRRLGKYLRVYKSVVYALLFREI